MAPYSSAVLVIFCSESVAYFVAQPKLNYEATSVEPSRTMFSDSGPEKYNVAKVHVIGLDGVERRRT